MQKVWIVVISMQKLVNYVLDHCVNPIKELILQLLEPATTGTIATAGFVANGTHAT